MKITVKVQPKSSQEKVVHLGNNEYKVFTHSPPADGEANKAVAELLAKYFKVAKSSVKIVSGETSRNKIVEIPSIDNCESHAVASKTNAKLVSKSGCKVKKF